MVQRPLSGRGRYSITCPLLEASRAYEAQLLFSRRKRPSPLNLCHMGMVTLHRCGREESSHGDSDNHKSDLGSQWHQCI